MIYVNFFIGEEDRGNRQTSFAMALVIRTASHWQMEANWQSIDDSNSRGIGLVAPSKLSDGNSRIGVRSRKRRASKYGKT